MEATIETTALLIWSYFFRAFLVALIVIGTFLIVKLIKQFFKNLESSYLKHRKQFEANIPGLDITRYRFLRHLIIGLIYFLGGVFALSLIPPLQHVALSILASSGVLALIVGFASQQTFSNFVSGLLLEIFRPIKVGDLIRIPGKNVIGVVDDITLRDTVVKTSENNTIIIPNSVISSEIIENLTWLEQQTYINLYLDYSANVDQAITTVRGIFENDARILDTRSDEQRKSGEPLISLKILELTPTAVHLQFWFWVRSEQEVEQVRCDSYKKIKEAFDSQKISFAQNQTIINNKIDIPSSKKTTSTPAS